ncbi:hypothetical protein EIP91_012251 [Steccherinum ochraceum]|uniref:Uncharacterized protein n=1 Tax=Steccherinum ochraceum TaxID=92696 RepID=A0A4R0RX76_9APHY|nr:hypothetical protein EIP91_012251 [Steccherinum ochraceum]
MSSTDQSSKIDDQDPRISYFGPSWFNVNTSNAAVFNKTLSSASEANAGFGFVFTGIQVAVYGSVVNKNGAAPPIIRFSVDNGTPVVYNAPALTIEGDALLFFQSDALSPTTHQIVANVTRATGDSAFLVDYLTVLPVGATIPASSSQPPLPTTPPANASTSSSAASSGTGQLAPTVTPNSDNQGVVSGKSSNAGPIAGGVVGGVVIIVLALLGFWWWRRRRNGASFRYPDEIGPTPAMRDTDPVLGGSSTAFTPDYGGGGQVTPYLLPQEYNASESHIGEASVVGGSSHTGSNQITSSFVGGSHADSNYLSSSSSASPYFANPNASASQPLLDSTVASEYSSGFTTGHGSAVAAEVPTRGLHPPQSSTDVKRPIVISATSNGNRIEQPEPSALPTPDIPQHADSGLRFSPQAEPEVPVLPMGAPPAYTAS